MSNNSKEKSSPTPIRLSIQSSLDDNDNHLFNKTFTPLIPNNLKEKNKYGFFQNKTFVPEKKSQFHPIEFYALGKIPSGTVYPSLQWNKGIKSTSNNIIERNALSINTKKFNQINVYKNLTSIYEQNVTENNYMHPVKMFRTYEKYKIPNNTTNFEVYKIMKEKFFSKDTETDNNKTEKKEEKKIAKKSIEDMKQHSNSGFIYKDPNDYTKKLLKNNTYYFDKNNTQMIKPKKWKIDGNK